MERLIYSPPFIIIPFYPQKNIYYLHNFGINEFQPSKVDPSKEFSLLFGSLFSMLGLATYMVFLNFI